MNVQERRVPPYIPSHTRPKILFIGQAPNDDEIIIGKPFVGTSGRELDRMCRLAGLVRQDHAVTNVFDVQVPDNDPDTIVEDAKVVRQKLKDGDPEWQTYPYPPFKRGKYLKPEWTHHLVRLEREIHEINPNLIVPMGNEALWAVTGLFGIEQRRGSVTTVSAPWMTAREGAPLRKVLPTFHPSYVLRNYKARIPVISDLIKAVREMEYPEIRRVPREIWTLPTLEDLHTFRHRYLEDAEVISIDIETSRGQITSIAFAPHRDLALVVPFTDWTLAYSHWPTLEQELAAWRFVREVCALPKPRKLMQNGSYDAQWLWEKLRIKVVNYSEDTRLLSHALYPELPKSLEFLGSVYEDSGEFGAWKQMRMRKDAKRDA